MSEETTKRVEILVTHERGFTWRHPMVAIRAMVVEILEIILINIGEANMEVDCRRSLSYPGS